MASSVEIGMLQWFSGTTVGGFCSDLVLFFYLLGLSNESTFATSCLFRRHELLKDLSNSLISPCFEISHYTTILFQKLFCHQKLGIVSKRTTEKIVVTVYKWF